MNALKPAGKWAHEAGGESDKGANPSKRVRRDDQCGDRCEQSDRWATQLTPQQLPELPTTPRALQTVLFPENSPLLIPVTAECHQTIISQYCITANKYLVGTDGSDLPAAFSRLVRKPFSGHCKMTVALFVAGAVLDVFTALGDHSSIQPYLEIIFAETETQDSTVSKALKLRARPDTVVTVEHCTMLMGEHRHLSLLDAINALSAMRQPITAMHYGPVKFLLAYAAGGVSFQWQWVSADGTKLMPIGRVLNLGHVRQRCIFIQSLVRAFFLLAKMGKSVPVLDGRLPLGVKVNRGKDRYLLIKGNTVLKVIPKFKAFAAETQTSFEAIKRAYEAAHTPRNVAKNFLVMAQQAPEIHRSTYQVLVGPLGFRPDFDDEEDVRALATCCCKAATLLHQAGIVHRDIRLGNVAQLDKHCYMLLDLESVAAADAGALPPGFSFSCWGDDVLDSQKCSLHYQTCI